MATTRILPLHIGKEHSFGKATSDIIDYVENPEKTDNGKLITRFACDSRCADAEFALAKRQYIQKTGRVRGKDDVIAYQVRQSLSLVRFSRRSESHRCGVCKEIYQGKAFVVCTHRQGSHPLSYHLVSCQSGL